jgi:hypothetical protein
MILGVSVEETEDDQETAINKAFRRVSIAEPHRFLPGSMPIPHETTYYG